jgi:hypothetical protein
MCLRTNEALEQRDVAYASRLERRIEDLLTRPRGRPGHSPRVRYRSFQYQAASWDRPRRVIAKVEHHLGELFSRVGFIVATLTGTNRAIVLQPAGDGGAVDQGGQASPATASGPTRSGCSATAAFQDRWSPDPACSVLRPAARREPLDITAVWPDSRAHRAARVASDDVIRSPTE